MYLTKCILIACAFSVLFGESKGSLWTKIKEVFMKIFDFLARPFIGGHKMTKSGIYLPDTKKEFLKILDDGSKKDPNQLFVVYVSASWCGPCKMLLPVIEGFVKKYPTVKFIKVRIDSEELKSFASKTYGVARLPTVMFIKMKAEDVDGKQVTKPEGKKMADDVVGAQKPEIYEAIIKEKINA